MEYLASFADFCRRADFSFPFRVQRVMLIMRSSRQSGATVLGSAIVEFRKIPCKPSAKSWEVSHWRPKDAPNLSRRQNRRKLMCLNQI